MKIVSSIELTRADYAVRQKRLKILGGFGRFGRDFLIGVFAGFVRGPNLFFLLVDYVASLVDPIGGLLTSFLRSCANEIASLVSFGAQNFAGLGARARRVQNPYGCSNANSGKKPQDAAAISIRHNQFLHSKSDGSIHPAELQFNARRE
jgi:hypothetical protein